MATYGVAAAFGLLVVACAYSGARFERPWAMLAYVVGLLIIFLPAARRLVARAPSRGERIGVVVVLGSTLYLVKLLQSPLGFSYFDEFQHWRTVAGILESKVLFGSNSLLPVSTRYPGLHNVTGALVELTGASVFAAGSFVVFGARLLVALSLFRLFELASRSARVAGVAVLVYLGNPHFLYFNSQFAYESLALPLAAFTFYGIALRTQARGATALLLTATIGLGVASVVVTHHVSSFAMTAFLGVWTLVHLACGRRRSGAGPTDAAVLALVLSAAWVLLVATEVRAYIGYWLVTGSTELLQLLVGDGSPRRPFGSGGIVEAALWERVVALAATGILVLAWPVGGLEVWRRYRGRALPVALAVAALAYPGSLALRLTEAGMEPAGRAMSFAFVPLGFVAALALRWVLARGRRNRLAPTLVTAAVATIFLGGAVVGAPAYYRLPGPYLVSADPRSIEPQGLQTARWARDWLGPGHRIAADRINRVLLGTYGGQRPVTSLGDDVVVGNLFFPETLDARALEVVRAGAIEYVVVDRRLSTGLPYVGVYFNLGEPHALRHETPIRLEALLKFDGLAGVHRIYDSGDIQIFDVRGLSDAW